MKRSSLDTWHNDVKYDQMNISHDFIQGTDLL